MFNNSKNELLDLIKRQGTLSVDEAVEQTDLAKSTLREHFLQLERDGYIQREYIRSGPGRPRLQYQLTQEGDRLFPSSESRLIGELIKYLKSKGDEKTIEDFSGYFGKNAWKRRKNRWHNRSSRTWNRA